MHVLQSRVLLRPASFEGSLAFYEDGLGLVRYRDWGSEPNRGVVFFLGGGFLELTEGSPLSDPRGDQAVRLWLQVANIQETHEELISRGLEVFEGPELKPWGLIEMSLRDPDEMVIAIIETPTSHPLRRRQ